jgi:hemolysin III
MVTHIVGGSLAIAAIPLLAVFAALHGNPWAIVTGSIYGVALVLMFTVSSVYHGLKPGKAKRVMRVIDHCDIYFLIAGTYTPILLVGIRPINPAMAWTLFGVEWGLAAVAVTLNAVDLKRFEKISMVCYIGMGWGVIVMIEPTIQAMTMSGFALLLAGGIAYTIGAVLYAVGKKVRYIHSVFHVFVLIGSVLHFLAILLYIM